MDEKLERRMRVVSLVHFGLTLCVAFLVYYMTPFSKDGRFHSALLETQIRHEIWSRVGVVILFALQPLPIFIVLASQIVLHAIWLNSPTWLAATLTWVVILLSVPLWSFYFGRIFIRAKDWLNHFPVLGKRVF
jgi:hypothetical protein